MDALGRSRARALLAAALFGLAAPAAKALLGAGLAPQSLAGVLYAGGGLALLAAGRRPPLGRAALPAMAGSVIAGGIAGPLLLLFGLAHAPASTASLALNVELPATALLAWAIRGEALGRRVAAGITAIVAGGALLSLAPGGAGGSALGVLAVAAASICWAIDNNFTATIAHADAIAVARVKCLVGGAVNLAIGYALGATPHAGGAINLALAAAVGALGYGASTALYVRAQRDLGAARTGALFGIAPFVGAVTAIAALHERPTLAFAAAGAAMAAGVWWMLTEAHRHRHRHEPLVHTHSHVHDEHHRHEHAPDDPAGEPHTHEHRHDALTHDHPHAPDLHHHHEH